MSTHLLCFPLLFARKVESAVDNSPVKIVCIGDSITQANYERFSWRYPLWKKLLDRGYWFDLVGSENKNYGENYERSPKYPEYLGLPFDKDHEGHWGWTADEILNGKPSEMNKKKLPVWLENYTPDIALIHLGTNDVVKNQENSTTVEELKSIISHLRKKNSNVKILLAQIIPCLRCDDEQILEIANLNASIASLGGDDELSTFTSPLIIVDQATGFGPKPELYLYDDVHPNELGEEKMAQKWYDAIVCNFDNLFCQRRASAQKTIYVDKNFHGHSSIKPTGESLLPFRTIGEAINFARCGAYIKIKAGSYPEKLNISKRIKMIGYEGSVFIGKIKLVK